MKHTPSHLSPARSAHGDLGRRLDVSALVLGVEVLMVVQQAYLH